MVLLRLPKPKGQLQKAVLELPVIESGYGIHAALRAQAPSGKRHGTDALLFRWDDAKMRPEMPGLGCEGIAGTEVPASQEQEKP